MFNRLRQAYLMFRDGPPKLILGGGGQGVLMPGETYHILNMGCPSCGVAMVRSDRKEDWHVDPSGHAQYSCTNDQCHDRPRYRRVDVLEPAMDQQAKSRAEKQAQEHESWERLVAMENRLTTWMRDRYKGHFRGQFESVAEIAIFVMSGGKEGRVTNPLSGDPPTTPPAT